MYSKHHAVASALVGSVAVVVLPPVRLVDVTVPPAVLIAYATATGVLIDLDHFLIARVRTGNWDVVQFCLRNPSSVLADQGAIFDPGDVGELHRLLSHLVITGVAVVALTTASSSLAATTAAVLYVHIVSDVAWDLHRLRYGRDVSVQDRTE